MLPLEQLAGHGKNPRAIQISLPLEQVIDNPKILPLEQCFDKTQQPCDTLTYSVGLQALRLPQRELETYKPRSLLKSIPMPSVSCDRNILRSPSMATSKLTDVLGETSRSLPQDSRVQVHQSQELGRVSITNIVDFGTKLSELSMIVSPDLSSSKIPQAYSVVEWMELFGDFPKAGTWANGRVSQLQHLKPPTVEKGFLSLPTPNSSTGAKSRPAGQTRCELWFRSNGLLADFQCLSPQIMGQLLGFPMDWTKCLWESKEDRLGELEADIYSVEQLCLPVQRSHSEELNISIPASSEDKKLPLEHEISDDDSKWIQLYDRLAELERKKTAIYAMGPVVQSGIWIEYGKVFKRKFRQAYYRSNKAIFPSKRQDSFAKSESGLVKRCYIGEENSKEVKAAGEAIARRNELEKISKEIKLIESKLCD